MTFGAVSFDDEFIIADILTSLDQEPYSLAQKATVIADHCALTYAGPQRNGEDICIALKKFADRGELDAAKLKAYLADVALGRKDLQVAALITERHGERTMLEIVHTPNAPRYEDPRLGRSVLVGTGGAHFDRKLGKHRMVPGQLAWYGQSARSHETAIARAVTVAGALLHLEGGGQGDRLSGAAYEIVVWEDRRRFMKVDNVMFFFWRIDKVEGRNRLLHPHLIYKTRYVDSWLLIHVLRPKAEGTKINDVPIYRLSSTHYIPPFLRHVTKNERQEMERLPPEVSKAYSGHFATFTHPRHGRVATANGGRMIDVDIERVPEGYVLRLKKEFVENMESVLNDAEG